MVNSEVLCNIYVRNTAPGKFEKTVYLAGTPNLNWDHSLENVGLKKQDFIKM